MIYTLAAWQICAKVAEEPFVAEIDDNDEKEAEEMAIDLWY